MKGNEERTEKREERREEKGLKTEVQVKEKKLLREKNEGNGGRIAKGEKRGEEVGA